VLVGGTAVAVGGMAARVCAEIASTVKATIVGTISWGVGIKEEVWRPLQAPDMALKARQIRMVNSIFCMVFSLLIFQRRREELTTDKRRFTLIGRDKASLNF
jgi:hypothetical protein